MLLMLYSIIYREDTKVAKHQLSFKIRKYKQA